MFCFGVTEFRPIPQNCKAFYRKVSRRIDSECGGCFVSVSHGLCFQFKCKRQERCLDDLAAIDSPA